MRRIAIAAIAALIALPAIGQWTRSHQSDTGTWVCAGPDGAEYDTLYDGAGAATIYCNGMAAAQRVIEAVLGVSVAEAALNLGQLQVCANGVLYVQDPTCASVGTGTDFAWTGVNVPNFNGLIQNDGTDVTFPHDLTQYCSGTDCPSVNYSLVTVSGSPCEPASSEFTISMGSLDNDLTATGTGTCRVRMEYMGDAVNMNSWSWSIEAAPGEDVLAPIPVTGLEATGVEGGVALEWLAATDNKCVKDYLVKKDGTTIATVTDGVQCGLTLEYTPAEIGTVGGTPSYDVNGYSHTIGCEGDGMATAANTDDSACVLYAQVTGNFDCYLTIDSITPSTGATFHQGGLFARSSVADARAPGVLIFGQYDTDGNQRLLIRERANSGSATQNVITPQLLSFRSIRFSRRGDDFTFYHRAASSAGWQVSGEATRALPSQLDVGAWGSDAQGTGGSTLEASQVACNDAPPVSHTDSSGTGGSYTVAARDTSDNAAADSVAVTGTPGAPIAGDGVKFNPGAYVAGFSFGSGPIQNEFAELCNTTNVEGVQMVVRWRQLETGSTTAGASYTFDTLQSWYDTLAACGLRLVIQLQRNIGGQNNPGPAYLESEAQYDGGTYYNSNYNSTYVKGWVPEVMDRLIALETALAAQFDEAEFFEGVIFPETVYGSPVAGDFSASGWITQMKRLIEARVPIWPNTNKIVFFNFLNDVGSAGYGDFIEHMEANEAVMGGPDIFPQGIGSSSCGASCTNPGTVQTRTTGQEHYIGNTEAAKNPSLSGIDYRPLMGYMGAVQPPEMGGKDGNHTPANLFAESNTELQASHTFWWYKKWQLDVPNAEGGGGTDEANWDSGGTLAPNGLKAFIEAGSANPSGAALTCPENYSDGCAQ